MKKINLKKSIALALSLATLIGTLVISASAANYTTNYSAYNQPEANDYAYWSGSRVVRGSSTTTAEVKWIQAALNYCIKNKGLNASYLDVDGSFGPASRKATKVFQSKYGLSVDGSFGPATIAKMKEVLTPAPAPLPTPSKPKAVSISDGWYTLTPKCAADLRLDVSGGTNGDGINIQIWQANQSNAQKFYVRSIGGGYYTISTCHDSMVLDVNKGYASNGTNVHQWHATSNNEAQQWTFQDAGSGYVWIVPKVSGSMRLDVYNGGSYNGVNIQIWSANDSDAQKWKLTSSTAPEVPVQPDTSQTTNTSTDTLKEDHTTDYTRFSAPDSFDYAYWSGSEAIRADSTTTLEVKWMQAALNYCIQNKGLSASYLDVDGSFGPASQTATRAFQGKYDLSADGSFGPSTIAKMKEILGLVVVPPVSESVTNTSPNTTNSNDTPSLKLIWPLANGAGYAGNPAGEVRGSRFHMGTDIPASTGTAILAVANGQVKDTGYDSDRGYYITIEHEEYICVYQHMNSSATVTKGTAVSQGQTIGYVGNTGLSYGAHLHFEIVLTASLSMKSDMTNCLYNDVNSRKLNPTYYAVDKGGKAGPYYELVLSRVVTQVSNTAELKPVQPAITESNANVSYSAYSIPGSSDYAYWSGGRSVMASKTTTQKVQWMQAALNYCIQNKNLNASYLDIDGSFGPASKAATEAFQRKYGLSVDGSFGPATISKMKSVLGIATTDSIPDQGNNSSNDAIPYNAGVPVTPLCTSSESSRSAVAYNQVIDQFDVSRNSRYTPYKLNKGDTYCNIFAWDVSIAMNAEIAHWVTKSDGKVPMDNITGNRELDANATYDWLEKYGGDYGWYIVSAKEAQSRANSGYPTIGIKKARIGHVVVVRPETEKFTFSNQGPVIAQAGSTNFNYGYIRDSYKNYTFYTHD